jgi:hypothetical protein
MSGQRLVLVIFIGLATIVLLAIIAASLTGELSLKDDEQEDKQLPFTARTFEAPVSHVAPEAVGS